MKSIKMIQWLGLLVAFSLLTGCYTTFRSVSYSASGADYGGSNVFVSGNEYESEIVETAYSEPLPEEETVVLQFRPSRLVVQKTYFNYGGHIRKVYYVADDPWYWDEPIFGYSEPDIFIHIGFGSTVFVPDPFDFWWASPVYYPVIPVVPVIPYYTWYPVWTGPVWYPPVCWAPPVWHPYPVKPYGRRDWDRRRMVTHRPANRGPKRDLQRPEQGTDRRITRPDRIATINDNASGRTISRKPIRGSSGQNEIRRIRETPSRQEGRIIRTTSRREERPTASRSIRSRTERSELTSYQRESTARQGRYSTQRENGKSRTAPVYSGSATNSHQRAGIASPKNRVSKAPQQRYDGSRTSNRHYSKSRSKSGSTKQSRAYSRQSNEPETKTRHYQRQQAPPPQKSYQQSGDKPSKTRKSYRSKTYRAKPKPAGSYRSKSSSGSGSSHSVKSTGTKNNPSRTAGKASSRGRR
ncbi:MAG: hypothetical protein Kow0037_24150 [Calditrichia bacterium]